MKFSLYITGGGTGVIPMLLDQGGASKYIYDIQVPYNCEAVDYLIGHQQKYCSEEVAKRLAFAAYRNMSYEKANFGIGVTASLRKSNEREGRENLAYVCMVDSDGVFMYKELRFTQKTRKEQEDSLAGILYEFIIEHVFKDYKYTHEVFQAITNNENYFIPVNGNLPCGTIYSGSFNPLHDGHRAIIKHHNAKYGDLDIEIAYDNADKGQISFYELLERVQQDFVNINGIWVTNTPKFIDKSFDLSIDGVRPSLVMGTDTYNRIPNNELELLKHTNIYIYPRGDMYVKGLLSSKHQIVQNFAGVNVSSTELRNAAK